MVLPGFPGGAILRPLQHPVSRSRGHAGCQDDVRHLWVQVDYGRTMYSNLVHLAELDGECDRLVGRAVLERGGLPPPGHHRSGVSQ